MNCTCGKLNMNKKNEVGMNSSDLKVKLCVGGTLFITNHDTLQTFPGTRLAKLTQFSTSYDKLSQEYFFDRDPIAFACILNYYRTSELHLPTNLCGDAIRRELEFWNIHEEKVSDCCLQLMYDADQDRRVVDILTARLKYGYNAPSRNTTWNVWKHRLWLVLDKPNSSKAAKILNGIFMVVIMASVIIFCMESVPEGRVDRQEDERQIVDDAVKQRFLSDVSNVKLKMIIETKSHPVMYGFDLVFLGVFTLELLLHFATCPQKCRFFLAFLNWIDIVSVCLGWLLFFVEQTFEAGLVVLTLDLYWAYLVMKSLYVLRLFRFFRLTKRFVELKVMMLAIKASIAELTLLLLTIIILATIFGSFEFYCEFSNNSFSSIPISIWWAVVTMTTVGYGDYYPDTYCGRLLGSACALCGLLILAMPIAIVATNFNNYYSRFHCRERQKKRWGKRNKIGAEIQDEMVLKDCDE